MKAIKFFVTTMAIALTLGTACLTESSTVNADICSGYQGQKVLSSARKATALVVNAPVPTYIGATVYLIYSQYFDGMGIKSVLTSYLVVGMKFIRLPDLCTNNGAPLAKPDFRFRDPATGTDIDTTRSPMQDQYLGFLIGTLTLHVQ